MFFTPEASKTKTKEELKAFLKENGFRKQIDSLINSVNELRAEEIKQNAEYKSKRSELKRDITILAAKIQPLIQQSLDTNEQQNIALEEALQLTKLITAYDSFKAANQNKTRACKEKQGSLIKELMPLLKNQDFFLEKTLEQLTKEHKVRQAKHEEKISLLTTSLEIQLKNFALLCHSTLTFFEEPYNTQELEFIAAVKLYFELNEHEPKNEEHIEQLSQLQVKIFKLHPCLENVVAYLSDDLKEKLPTAAKNILHDYNKVSSHTEKKGDEQNMYLIHQLDYINKKIGKLELKKRDVGREYSRVSP